MKVIDISHWNGKVDFEIVKKAGISGVMIHAGYGNDGKQVDELFLENYKNAKSKGLLVGCYWYSYADSLYDFHRETEVFYNEIKNLEFDLPCCMDIEEDLTLRLKSEVLIDMFNYFKKYFKDRNKKYGIYVNTGFIKQHFNPNNLGIPLWLADWTKNVSNYNCFMRQYDNDYRIDGVNSNLDINDLFWSLDEIEKFYKTDESKPLIKILYGGKWYEIGINDEYRIENEWLQGICISNFPKGSWYQAHTINGIWLPIVLGGDVTDYNQWAGKNDGSYIDCLKIYYKTPPNESIKYAKYQVGLNRLYPVQIDNSQKNGMDGYAGVYGRKINRIKIDFGGM